MAGPASVSPERYPRACLPGRAAPHAPQREEERHRHPLRGEKPSMEPSAGKEGEGSHLPGHSGGSHVSRAVALTSWPLTQGSFYFLCRLSTRGWGRSTVKVESEVWGTWGRFPALRRGPSGGHKRRSETQRPLWVGATRKINPFPAMSFPSLSPSQ